MALDTANKRASAIHIGLPWRGLFPIPDGTISQADRQQGAGFYAGILGAGAPLLITPVVIAPIVPVILPPLELPPEPTLGIVPLGATTLRWGKERIPKWRLRPSGRRVTGHVLVTVAPTRLAARAIVSRATQVTRAQGLLTESATLMRSTGTVRRVVRGTVRLGRSRADHDEAVALDLLGWHQSRPFEDSSRDA